MAAFLFIFSFCGSASAVTINVNNSTSNAIKNAINTAQPGDTLNLSAGIYYENHLVIDKNLTITGPITTVSPTAIIDAQHGGRIFNITSSNNVTLLYLTLQNGNATHYGGAIYNSGTCNVFHLNIDNNNAADYGGGICNDCGNLILTDSVINGNTADYGGGIYNNGGTCTITNSTLNNNNANNNGGGIYTGGSSVTLSNSTINDNKAISGGGIYNGGGTCTVTNSTIKNNKVNGDGGGIYINIGTSNISDSIIQGNTATNGGGIYNDGTCIVNNSSINGNTATNGGGISIANGYITVSDSSINNNSADNGGGIYNSGNCHVYNSIINGNTANYFGGGIYNLNYVEGCSVVNCSINGNTATNYGGGGIFNNGGTCTVTNSSINGNTATNYGGGGIYNTGVCTISGCNFESNNGKGEGNAFYNEAGDSSNRIIHYNRFYDTASGYEICCEDGSVDAKYNWWGSNFNPVTKVSGAVDASSWLVLSVNAKPVFIGKNGSSNITANLWFDSNGIYHDPVSGHVFDGIPVTFYSTIGIINPSTTSNGSILSTLTAGTVSGIANVYAILDDQFVGTSVIIDAVPPTVIIIDPTNNAVINNTSKVVKITLNEAVQKGTAFNSISITLNGTPIPITSALNGNVLTLTKTGNYANGTYTINIPTNALMDAAGNLISSYTSKFAVDTVPPKVSSTYPTNGKTGFSRTGTISVKFSENIYSSTYYNEITVKNLTTGKTTTISKSINGSTLSIKSTSKLSANTWYQVTIPLAAVKDKAGNDQTTSYTYKFKTGA